MLTMPIPEYLHEILDDVRDTTSGELADYIPELKSADPNPLAVALCTVNGRFRNIPIIQFFYGADNLDCDQWEIRDLTDYGLSLSDKYMTIALECGIAF